MGKNRLATLLLLTASAMLVVMAVFESLKQFLFPGITVWQSHIVTIFFTTLVTTGIASFVIRKILLSEEKFFKLFLANPDWVIIGRLADGRYLDVNDAFLRMTGYTREEVIGHTARELNVWVDLEDWTTLAGVLQSGGRISNREVMFRMKSGELRSMLQSAERIDLGDEAYMISVCKDITERKKTEEERKQLIVQLEEALSKVKLLGGFLPICASCKKIRTDKGYWEQIEVYIRNHSEAEFTHGICPDCAKKLYAKYFK